MTQITRLARSFSREMQPYPEIRDMSLSAWFMIFCWEGTSYCARGIRLGAAMMSPVKSPQEAE